MRPTRSLTRSFTEALLIWRAERVVRRAARAERRRLDRELSSYTTQAARDDLLATFDRYPDEVTARYREALDRHSPTRRPRLTTHDWPARRPGG